MNMNDQVKDLLTRGLGRRRIAKELGITEWKVRKIISKLTGSTERIDTVPVRTSRKRTKNKRITRQKENRSSSTTISIKLSSDPNPIIHKTINRPVSLKVAVLSDIHYPYQDEKSCELADMFLEDWEPDVLVYNGDIADFYSISSYNKSPKRKMNIQDELDYTFSELLKRKKRLSSIKQSYYLEGNHENRLTKAAMSIMPSMASLRGISVESSLRLKELDIDFIPGSEELQIGDLLFTHGHYARKHAGNSARGHFEQYGCSILVGHVHRLSVGYKRNKFGNHALIENGTLCDFDVEYAKYPDWQQGFTTLEYDGEQFVATPRPINNYKIIADGKVYAI